MVRQESFLWYALGKEEDIEDADTLAAHCCRRTSSKTSDAWQIVHEKEANGKELPMMEELKQLESLHLLKSLATSHCYKEYLVCQIVKQKKVNGEELPTIEEWDVLESNHQLKCFGTNPLYMFLPVTPCFASLFLK